ncbi:MarR family winged helix-turn-helix transcriptional regulator [Ramlibacter rhizophilus]|nr:MarR family transcriptional regulator [Ramlibacter rhizophilus]
MWSRPGFLIRRLHQINDALYFEECKENITPVQFGILTALSTNPWLDQKAIGRELALDRTTTAQVLSRLVDKGLVEVRVNPDDRRSRLSVITKAGLNIMRALQDSMWQSQARLLSPLSEAEKTVFMKLAAKVVQAHEDMDSA